MKLIYKLLLVFLIPNVASAQYCNVVVTPMDSIICLGDSVLVSATATILNAGSNQFFDFNTASIPAGWTAGGGNTFGAPCGANPTGTPYYWASTAGAGTPLISTASFDVTCGGELIFDMVYSIQSGPTPCEGPDEQDEGVEVQYSTDGGLTWTTIIYYNPWGFEEATLPNGNNNSISGPTPYTSWSNFTVTIPPAAQTTSTSFRWIQANSSGSLYDNWGLDNILIFASGVPCNQSAVINWDNGLVDTEQFYVVPTADSAFVALVYDTLGVFQCASDTIFIQIFPDVMTYNLVDTVYAYCPTTSPEVEVTNFGGTFGPWGVNWTTIPSTDNPVNFPASNEEHDTTVYYVDITDGCGYLRQDTVVMITNLLLEITSMNSTPVSSCNLNTGQVWAEVAGLTTTSGQPYYNFTGPNQNPGPISVNGNAMANLPPGWYYFTVTDNVCTASDSVEVTVLEAPVAQLSADPTSGCNPLAVQFTNTSENTVQSIWDFGNGNSVTVNDLSGQSQIYTSSAVITLVVKDIANCTDTATVSISIVNCGCNDPDALNFDPTAQINDGSCIYPNPIVTAPNVFSPNTDEANPFYILNTEFVSQLELIIVNRWGNVMYETNQDITLPDSFVGWNGKAPNGSDAEEGTYFYRYVAKGIYGDTLEGHGFLQLVR